MHFYQVAKVHSNCFRNVYKWILPIAESRCQLFQECVAPSSKPLLAGASGKGLHCRELAWKCGWNEFFKLMFYMFCQFIRRSIVLPIQSMQKHWRLCVVHNEKCKFVETIIETNCLLSHRRGSATFSTISHSRVMSQSKPKMSRMSMKIIKT